MQNMPNPMALPDREVVRRPRKRSTRPRDSQRRKVYRAETRANPDYFRARDWNTHDEVVEFVEKVWRSRWYKKRFGNRRFRVSRQRRGCRGNGNRWEIKIPPERRHRWLVLHEMAHALQPRGTAPHGKEFARLLLDFVSRHGFMPFAWWRILVGSAGLLGLWLVG